MPDRLPSTPRLERLLRSLHRRGTLLRVAECGGIGLLIGTGSAIAVTLFLWAEGRPSIAASVGMMSLGTMCGLMWGSWRRPSAVAAAVRADRQLQADDLFSTAASLALSGTTDPWAATVLAIAERRSREISASAVVLRRFGGRAWGGIGLSTAVAVTLALLTTSADTTQAKAGTAQRADRSSPPQSRPLIAWAPESPLLPPAGGRSPGEDRDPGGDPRTDVAATRPATTPSARGAESTGAATSSDGTGAGAGKTVPMPATQETNPVAATAQTVRPPATLGTRPAAGTGAANASATPGAVEATGRSGAHSGSTSAPPWQSETWSADVSNAREQIQSGRVPAGYRDLVRQYFDVK